MKKKLKSKKSSKFFRINFEMFVKIYRRGHFVVKVHTRVKVTMNIL